MDNFERKVAERLRAQDTGPLPPSGLPSRILDGVRVRRRRRRAAAATSMIVAVTLTIGVPVYLSAQRTAQLPHAGPSSPAAASAPGGSIVLAPAPLPSNGPTEIGRTLPGGWQFTAFGVGSDGTVLGVGAKYAKNGTGVLDGTLWRTAQDGSPPSAIATPAGLWTAGIGAGVMVWPEHRDSAHDYQLMCQDHSGIGHQLGVRGVAHELNGFSVGGNIIVWTDEGGHTVWTAKGCTGRPRTLDTSGFAVAFSYPYAFVLDARSKRGIREIDVRTGTVTARTLPADAAKADLGLFAAGANTLSYSDGHALVVIETRTWRPRVVSAQLPHSNGLNGERTTLTAGDSTVVYTTRPLDGGPDGDSSVIYRVGHPNASTVSGEAFTNGHWLLWRDKNVYKLQDVSVQSPQLGN